MVAQDNQDMFFHAGRCDPLPPPFLADKKLQMAFVFSVIIQYNIYFCMYKKKETKLQIEFWCMGAPNY